MHRHPQAIIKRTIGIIFLILGLLLLASFAFLSMVFSEGETREGTLVYYLQIPSIIAHIPRVGSTTTIRFSYGFYDNGTPQRESISYCTTASRDDVDTALTQHLARTKFVRKDLTTWANPATTSGIEEIHLSFIERDVGCQGENFIEVSRLQWPN
ncbi:MAG: hypothetical protein R3E60_03445 [Alphaproteobacteria bacterium]